jgi:pyruvate dehydrogenase kinase 2/3/4
MHSIDINNQEQRLVNAQFLHKELPVRIAQRAYDLLTLPYGLSDVLPIRQVAHVYLRYLERFQEFPVPDTPEKETEFTDMLQGIITDKASIPMALARGVAEWEARHKEDLDQQRLQEMEDAFYRFFMARTGLRFLVEHHILSSPARSKTSSIRSDQTYFDENEEITLGCIKTDCDPVKEVHKVVKAVARQTDDHYGICPEIQIVDSSKQTMKFTYVPHHLQHMVGELLKNSCRATVRK